MWFRSVEGLVEKYPVFKGINYRYLVFKNIILIPVLVPYLSKFSSNYLRQKQWDEREGNHCCILLQKILEKVNHIHKHETKKLSAFQSRSFLFIISFLFSSLILFLFYEAFTIFSLKLFIRLSSCSSLHFFFFMFIFLGLCFLCIKICFVSSSLYIIMRLAESTEKLLHRDEPLEKSSSCDRSSKIFQLLKNKMKKANQVYISTSLV